MGISVYPDDALNQSDLVKFADTAMYDSKKNAGNKYQFYFKLKTMAKKIKNEEPI
jgi:GGDEF domain-containing protein